MKDLINFFIDLGRLKKMPKRGWVLIGVKDPESVSDHSFRVAVMAWLLAKEKKEKLNIEKVIKIALAHDLCETFCGDLTPYDYGSLLPEDKKEWPRSFDKWPRLSGEEKVKRNKEKYQRESDSLKRLLSDLPLPAKKEIMALWQEYEKGSNKEARFVKQINRLETLFQALEYARENKKPPYRSWWIGSKEIIDDPLLVEFMNELGEEFSDVSIDKKEEKEE